MRMPTQVPLMLAVHRVRRYHLMMKEAGSRQKTNVQKSLDMAKGQSYDSTHYTRDDIFPKHTKLQVADTSNPLGAYTPHCGIPMPYCDRKKMVD